MFDEQGDSLSDHPCTVKKKLLYYSSLPFPVLDTALLSPEEKKFPVSDGGKTKKNLDGVWLMKV